jgi:patatin-like phospholipase/acyl hydrolase
MFDLVCGTSTGGILALALGIKHKPLNECKDLYLSIAKKVTNKKKKKKEVEFLTHTDIWSSK